MSAVKQNWMTCLYLARVRTEQLSAVDHRALVAHVLRPEVENDVADRDVREHFFVYVGVAVTCHAPG